MDPYFKKQIVYPLWGKKFVFDVGETLFSSFAIDHGTDFLIRNITPNHPKIILDLGCGYGPIGITMAYKYPKSQVTMVDKDLLAVRYSKQNILKNGASNVTVLGSVGMEAVQDETYDLILSNIPAKIGDRAITQEFILLPYEHLNSGGELWIVVVNALNHLIPHIRVNKDLRMEEVKRRKGHTIYRIIKSD